MSRIIKCTKELKNIPVSTSLLHEQEYKNLYSFFKKRRASSEKYEIYKSYSIASILYNIATFSSSLKNKKIN